MTSASVLNVDGTSYFALPPAEQMAVFRRLTSAINGMVMSLGVSPPAGYTYHDLSDAGFAYVMFAGSGVSAVANALADVFKEIRTTGTDAGYFKNQNGKYTDPITLMKALKLEEYVDIDRRFSP